MAVKFLKDLQQFIVPQMRRDIFFKVVLAFFENDESFANDNNAGYCSFIRSIMYNVEFHPVATSMINL